MSWKVHETDEVFAALRGLCSNSYRMYDPSESHHYYDYDCETYECAVEDAAREYERLLKHCKHQREQLAKRSGSQTIDILMELLNEYQGSECAIAEDRVTWYADRLDGRTEDERMEERTRTEQNGAGITDELRECIATAVWQYENGVKTAYIPKDKLAYIADRIDEAYSVKVERLEKYRAAVNAMLKEYVKLPADADGVPIHVGDEMDVGIVFAIGDEGVFMVENGFSGKYDVECFDGFACHHVQPDSWERIIEDACDMASRCCDDDAGKAELVERCRRLAGEGK